MTLSMTNQSRPLRRSQTIIAVSSSISGTKLRTISAFPSKELLGVWHLLQIKRIVRHRKWQTSNIGTLLKESQKL